MVKRTTIQAIGVLAGVFLLGALAGGAGVYAVAKREAAQLVGPRPQLRRMHALERRLGLNSDQRARVQEIFSRYREQLDQTRDEIMSDCGQPMREKMDAMDSEIRAVLDDEQRQIFDQLREERRRRGLLGPPPGGDGPRGARHRRGRGPFGSPPVGGGPLAPDSGR